MMNFGKPNIEQLKNRKKTRGLVKALEYYKDKKVPQAAAKALEQLGWEPEQNEAGAWYWIARNDWKKALALGALAVVPLLGILKLGDNPQRVEAAKLLGRIGDARAVQPLISACESGNEDVRVAAIQALSLLQDPRVFYTLVSASKSTNLSEVRHSAISALGNVDDQRVQGVLIAALKDTGFYNVRSLAASVLGEIGDSRAVAALNLAKKEFYFDRYTFEAAEKALRKIDIRNGRPGKRADRDR